MEKEKFITYMYLYNSKTDTNQVEEKNFQSHNINFKDLKYFKNITKNGL